MLRFIEIPSSNTEGFIFSLSRSPNYRLRDFEVVKFKGFAVPAWIQFLDIFQHCCLQRAWHWVAVEALGTTLAHISVSTEKKKKVL